MEEEANSGGTSMGLTAAAALLALQTALVPTPDTAFATLVQAAPPDRQLGTPWTFRFGPQRPDLVRYNRVEALSLGARGQMLMRGVSYAATVRFGVGDLHPNIRLDAVTQSLDQRFVFSGYHELAAIEERARHFGVANSLMALVAGQDDGDYYRRTGVSWEWTPPTSSPRTFRIRTFVEMHTSVVKETDVQVARLWDDEVSFRQNIVADHGMDLGGSVQVGRRWGTDPRRTRGGLDAYVQAATNADPDGAEHYARSSLGGIVTFALPARLRLSLEAAGGTSWGSPTRQRLWYLGGPLTLRGYDPLSAGGQSFGRGRAELARAFSFGRLAVFSDAGWAGNRGDIDLDDGLFAGGVGLALIDGILRIDGAWRLDSTRRFRVDVYLDQLL